MSPPPSGSGGKGLPGLSAMIGIQGVLTVTGPSLSQENPHSNNIYILIGYPFCALCVMHTYICIVTYVSVVFALLSSMSTDMSATDSLSREFLKLKRLRLISKVSTNTCISRKYISGTCVYMYMYIIA